MASERSARRAARRDDEDPVDLTSMIDVVFLLLIFFMVTSSMASQAEMKVPEARHVLGMDPAAATMITIKEPQAADGEAAVVLGDGTGSAVGGDDEIRAAIEDGLVEGKKEVIIKAEKKVRHRDVLRVARIVASIEGVQLRLGVREKR